MRVSGFRVFLVLRFTKGRLGFRGSWGGGWV